MKLKDLSLIFTLGVVAILLVIVNMLSYLFIEKGLLLVIIAATTLSVAAKWLTGILF